MMKQFKTEVHQYGFKFLYKGLVDKNLRIYKWVLIKHLY